MITMKNRRKLIFGISSALVVALLAVAGCGPTAQTATTSPAPSSNTATPAAAPSRVVLMVGGIEKQIYLPFELTERLGYFKDQGLNVVLMTEAAGQDAEVALLAKQVDGTGGFYDHTIDIQTKGKYIESVVQMAGNPGERLMLADKLKDQVKTLADLKGKKIGITDFGSSTNNLASFLVVKGGNQVSDYTPVPVGAGDTLIAAMKQGQIDLAVTTEPTVSRLISMGLAHTFVDMNSKEGVVKALGAEYPATCLYMRNDYVQAHPDIVQKLANALVKTLKYMSTHTPEEIAAQMPEAYMAGNKDMYITALKGTLPMFNADGKMTQGAPEKVREVLNLVKKEVKSATIDLSKTYTNDFVDKAQ